MQHYRDCERLTIRDIAVFNHVSYNNDGLNIDSCRDEARELPIVLVDHGSPVAAVSQVRQTLATQLQQLADLDVEQACMERRIGEEYDFNGLLLADWLSAKAQQGEPGAVVAMLFLLPGKHAGEGGDVATICRDALADYPDFDLRISPLVGEHPQLIEMLSQRLSVALPESG
jgi:sirohydrochlorin ferrochelatase